MWVNGPTESEPTDPLAIKSRAVCGRFACLCSSDRSIDRLIAGRTDWSMEHGACGVEQRKCTPSVIELQNGQARTFECVPVVRTQIDRVSDWL